MTVTKFDFKIRGDVPLTEEAPMIPTKMTVAEAVVVFTETIDGWLPKGYSVTADAVEALSILSALAEENAALKEQLDISIHGSVQLQRENAALKAEAGRLKNERTERQAAIWAAARWKARTEKAEAELDAARPLLDCVLEGFSGPHGEWVEKIFQKALAYRARERKEPK